MLSSPVSLRSCITYHETLGLLVEHPSAGSLLWLIDQAGELRSIGLYGPVLAMPDRPTRFFPIQLGRETDPDRPPRFVVVDLEQAAITSERHDSGDGLIVRRERLWYLISPGPRMTTVTVLDGVTGTTRTRHIRGGIAPIKPTAIAGGSLWVYVPTKTTGALAVARLDARTLEPLYVPPHIQIESR